MQRCWEACKLRFAVHMLKMQYQWSKSDSVRNTLMRVSNKTHLFGVDPLVVFWRLWKVQDHGNGYTSHQEHIRLGSGVSNLENNNQINICRKKRKFRTVTYCKILLSVTFGFGLLESQCFYTDLNLKACIWIGKNIIERNSKVIERKKKFLIALILTPPPPLQCSLLAMAWHPKGKWCISTSRSIRDTYTAVKQIRPTTIANIHPSQAHSARKLLPHCKPFRQQPLALVTGALQRWARIPLSHHCYCRLRPVSYRGCLIPPKNMEFTNHV